MMLFEVCKWLEMRAEMRLLANDGWGDEAFQMVCRQAGNVLDEQMAAKINAWHRIRKTHAIPVQ